VHATHVYRAGVQEVYLNGVLDSTRTAGAPNNDSTEIQIGSRNGAEGPGWNGCIDDVAIFTSALSTTDIAALASPTADPVALGAVAYYDFEDDQTGSTAANLVDVAASGLTGTPDPDTGIGAPALQELTGIGDELPPLPPVASWAAGAPNGTTGGSVAFDGQGTSFLNSGIDSELIGSNRGGGSLGTDYSVSMWINSAEDDGAGNIANNKWVFGTQNQGLHMGYRNGGLAYGHWNADAEGTTALASNTWVHVTFTFDADGGTVVDPDTGLPTATGLQTIYINGGSPESFSNAAPDRSTTDLIIGGNGGNGSWVGMIDDVAIFDSVLSATDVAALHTDTTQAVSLGAVAYYDFEDDQTGSTAANLVDVATSGMTSADGSASPQQLDRIAPNVSEVLLGDVDLSGTVDFLDITPFIGVLSGSGIPNQPEADCDESGVVDFLDITPFIAILSGGGS
jgi:hypothetical protein